MTILNTSWGFHVSATSDPQTLFAAIPLFRQCPRWTAASAIGAENHKVRARVHVTTTATLNLEIQADTNTDNPISISEPTGTTNAWNETWPNADIQEDYPDGSGWGIFPPDLTAQFAPVNIEAAVASGTQIINGMEIGLETDIDYDGGNAQVISRSGASRPYLENAPGSAFLVSGALADTLNKILYESEYRISCPLVGR